jgi:hypothetical protein
MRALPMGWSHCVMSRLIRSSGADWVGTGSWTRNAVAGGAGDADVAPTAGSGVSAAPEITVDLHSLSRASAFQHAVLLSTRGAAATRRANQQRFACATGAAMQLGALRDEASRRTRASHATARRGHFSRAQFCWKQYRRYSLLQGSSGLIWLHEPLLEVATPMNP